MVHSWIGLIVICLVVGVVSSIFVTDPAYKRLIFGVVCVVVLIGLLGLLGLWPSRAVGATLLTVSPGHVSLQTDTPINAFGDFLPCTANVRPDPSSPWQGLTHHEYCPAGDLVFSYDPVAFATWPLGVDTLLWLVDGCPKMGITFGPGDTRVVYECAPVINRANTWGVVKQLFR